jgi:hypothetical protein
MCSLQYVWPILSNGSKLYLWACGPYGAYGEYGTRGTFCACGTCVTYVDETCGTFVADVECGTYNTHVPYLQMIHISMNFQMNINMRLQVDPKIK